MINRIADNRKMNAFTIVELLIVIVVIGILSTISIVGYNGIQTRANNTVVKGDISSLAKIFQLHNAEYGSYPTTGTSINASVGGFKVSNPSSYAQAPNSLTNLTVCFSLDGSKIAVAAKSTSGGAHYAYSGDGFAIKAMSETDWVSTSLLAFERCQSIDPDLSPTRPNTGTYMNFNGYKSDDIDNGPWREWTRGG